MASQQSQDRTPPEDDQPSPSVVDEAPDADAALDDRGLDTDDDSTTPDASLDPPILTGENRAVLLVDCGSDASALTVLLREIEDNDCQPVVRRAYGDWRTGNENQQKWADQCVAWALDPIQVHGHNYHTTAGRNMATLIRMSIDAVRLAEEEDLTHFFILANSPHLAPLALHLREREKQLIVVGTVKSDQPNAFFDLAWHREILVERNQEGEGASSQSSAAQAHQNQPLMADAPAQQEVEEHGAVSAPLMPPESGQDWWVPLAHELCLQHGERGMWLPLTKLGAQLRYNFPGYNPSEHGKLLPLVKRRTDLFDIHPDTRQSYSFPLTHHIKLREQQLPPPPEPKPRERRSPTPRLGQPPRNAPSGYRAPRYVQQPDYDTGWGSGTERPRIR